MFASNVSGRPILPSGGDGSEAPRAGGGPATTLAAVTVSRSDGAARIVVTGELDLANAELVEQQILGGVDGGLAAITLDLTGLRYIDSAGLWILFRLGTRLATARIAGEVLVPADGPVWRMVETAGVAAAIAVRPVP
ncbi:MAG: anti-sigma factor antagonist [Pseudonocardiales bacterium]|nr:anti-sigma factor antagonist [Pseudonocardiales bacterium]